MLQARAHIHFLNCQIEISPVALSGIFLWSYFYSLVVPTEYLMPTSQIVNSIEIGKRVDDKINIPDTAMQKKTLEMIGWVVEIS